MDDIRPGPNFKVPSQHSPGVTEEKPWKTSVRMAGPESRTHEPQLQTSRVHSRNAVTDCATVFGTITTSHIDISIPRLIRTHLEGEEKYNFRSVHPITVGRARYGFVHNSKTIFIACFFWINAIYHPFHGLANNNNNRVTLT